MARQSATAIPGYTPLACASTLAARTIILPRSGTAATNGIFFNSGRLRIIQSVVK
jgi:hypothetical protein